MEQRGGWKPKRETAARLMHSHGTLPIGKAEEVARITNLLDSHADGQTALDPKEVEALRTKRWEIMLDYPITNNWPPLGELDICDVDNLHGLEPYIA